MSSSKAADKSTKKLKQACLPFKLTNSPGDDVNSKCRKRKLSGTENDEGRVENPKVELVNGGTKCFIKSEDENNINSKVSINPSRDWFLSYKSVVMSYYVLVVTICNYLISNHITYIVRAIIAHQDIGIFKLISSKKFNTN